MPKIDYYEQVASIEWNDDINIDENRRRTQLLLSAVNDIPIESTAYIGVQDYVVDQANQLSKTEAELYFKTSSPDSIAPLNNAIRLWLKDNYPNASVKFSPPVTIFEKLFETAEADIVAQLSERGYEASSDEIKDIEGKIKTALPDQHSSTLAFVPQKLLIIDRQALQLYNVNIQTLQNLITEVVAGEQVTELHSYNQYMPVYIKGDGNNVDKFIAEGFVNVFDNNSKSNTYVPIRRLVRQTTAQELKTVTAGKNGRYVPIYFYDVDDAETLCNTVRSVVNSTNRWDVDFSGAFFGNKAMVKQLAVILLISIMLMYFIMCAQFESFLQPLIVMVEIPIDVCFALVVLWLSGCTLNLMSGIGIIVSCGIIVNDSILKLDTINELRKQGMSIATAVHTAGQRRLRAIVMTSLTTIGAALPILFTSDMGSELQQPLAVAMISTMAVGTFVSLFVMPLIYIVLVKPKSYEK